LKEEAGEVEKVEEEEVGERREESPSSWKPIHQSI